MTFRPRRAAPAIHLNLNVRGLPQSATLLINERAEALSRAGRQIIKLGLGQSPFPVPQAVVEALKANSHRNRYLPVKGLPALRAAIAQYYGNTQNLDRSAEDVLVGPGSKELMFLVQLVYYGDIVIPTPSWVSYAPQAHIIGRHIRWVSTRRETGWRLTPQELDRLCAQDPERPRLVILNYPSNPSGVTYVLDELKALAEVARRYRVVLLSDEIYGELHFKGQHVSIARFYPEGTITSTGISKWCGAGGWRLGAFTFPPALRWLLDAMAVVASETLTSTSAPIQYAAVRAFQGGTEIDQYLAQSRRILRTLGRYLARRLRDVGVAVPEPQGAFNLFADFGPFRTSLRQRGIVTSEQLCEHLLEHAGVATLPGTVFGRSPEELTARLAYVDFDGARALEAVHDVSHQKELEIGFLQTHCSNVVDAADRVCAWLQR